MLKSEKNADFGVAIRQLYQYGHKFTPEVARGLAVSIRRNGEEIIKSEREREIPEMLFKGFSTKEIAEEIFLSNHTVESQKASKTKV